MVSKGDLFLDLKRNQIYPKNPDYSDHILNWFKSNDSKIFPKCEKNECGRLLLPKTSWLDKFAKNFKTEIRQKWKETSSK